MKSIKKSFNDKFPQLFRFSSHIYYFLIRLITGKRRTQIIFHKIYKLKNWGALESVSGPGSNLKNTENLRMELPVVINELNIKSFLDIPCGDCFWMKEISLPLQRYIGADIVEELVNQDNALFADDKRSFITLDLSKDNLPEVVAVFCRDCLPHLSVKLIKASIRRIKSSGSKYLFTSTYTACKENIEIHVGG
ncbi:MAG: class I SAM-dependent methyltransferase, partial [Ignavibacteria bacterium]|nr:class I SAM-dependent methyltransferase [Ignavibacteria bacterium]